MNTIVKGLLQKQEEERRNLAVKVVAERNEMLIALGCEDMIGEVSDSKLETKLAKALNEIEVLKKKCKEVSILKACLTKAEKAKAKKAETIKELEAKLKNVEVKVETVVDTKEIKRLQKELEAEKKKYATLQRTNSNLRSENNKLKDVIAELEADTIETNIEEKKEEDTFVPPAIKEELILNSSMTFKNKGTKLYESQDHYVMAKSNVKDLVIIPKSFKSEINLESDNARYEDILVNKFNFDEKRQTISPVNVYENNEKYRASFSRTEARESLFQFSFKDVFAGYICCSYGKTYLWSWDQQKSEEPFIYDFGQKLKGKNPVVYAKDRAKLTEIIKEMNKKYLEEVKVFSKENEYNNNTKEEAIERSNNFDNRIAQLNAMQSEFGGLCKNNAPAPIKEETAPKKELSNSASAFADKMF